MFLKDDYLALQDLFYEKRHEISLELPLIDISKGKWENNNNNNTEWIKACTIQHESIRIISGEINLFRENLRTCTAWNSIMNSLEQKERVDLLYLIARNDIKSMMLAPYEIKQRFAFYLSYLLHLTRLISDPGWEERCFPDDEYKISIKTINQFKKWQEIDLNLFLECLDNIDSKDFNQKVINYRRQFEHRIPSEIEVGVSQILKRKCKDGKFCYVFGGTKPLRFSIALTESINQHGHIIRAYKSMLDILDELSTIWKSYQ